MAFICLAADRHRTFEDRSSASSHPPNGDRGLVVLPGRLLAPEDLLRPGPIPGPVEDHKVPLVGRATVHVGGGLLQALTNRALHASPQDFALDNEPLGVSIGRPDDEQVGPAPSQPVLPFDASAAVDDPLQERLQQELRACLLRSADPAAPEARSSFRSASAHAGRSSARRGSGSAPDRDTRPVGSHARPLSSPEACSHRPSAPRPPRAWAPAWRRCRRPWRPLPLPSADARLRRA